MNHALNHAAPCRPPASCSCSPWFLTPSNSPLPPLQPPWSSCCNHPTGCSHSHTFAFGRRQKWGKDYSTKYFLEKHQANNLQTGLCAWNTKQRLPNMLGDTNVTDYCCKMVLAVRVRRAQQSRQSPCWEVHTLVVQKRVWQQPKKARRQGIGPLAPVGMIVHT